MFTTFVESLVPVQRKSRMYDGISSTKMELLIVVGAWFERWKVFKNQEGSFGKRKDYEFDTSFSLK